MSAARGRSARTLRLRGIVTVAVLAAIVTLVVVKPFSGDDGMVEFDVLAPAVPDGIQIGVPVDVRGETIGSVCGLDTSQPYSTRLTICAERSEIGELTNDSAVSFVSRNLFGSDAVRLGPATTGVPVRAGSVIELQQAPADNTMTAIMRSAGRLTLPVLTPELTVLLRNLSDTTTRLAPFMTATTVALQTLQRGQTARIKTLLPVATDAFNGLAVAGASAISGLEITLTTPLLADKPYTESVTSMIGDIGDLFSGLGALFNGMSGFGAVLDLANAYATPLGTALRGVTPSQLAQAIHRFGNAFHTDPRTGRTTLSTEVNLELVPGFSTPVNQLLAGLRGKP
uniref:mammalian cell entry protein n=1 Tax=Gordonia sp. B7-2 TaxID=3420932 RepID=UPI003D93FB83